MRKFYCPILSAIALLAVTFALTGCRGGRDKGNLETKAANNTNRDSDELPALGPDVIACGFGSAGLDPIYFDYDSTVLTAAAGATLATNADHLREAPDAVIQIAGHCDERGTQEYNLALGERRAQRARDHLRQLGIPGDRLVTISYGEEQPAVPGGDEPAWARNRRCEFNRAIAN